MEINDIQKYYDNLETAVDKYNFWKDIQKLNNYMEKDFHDNIILCNCCKTPIYKKDLVKTLDNRCHCPKCSGVIIRYYK